MLSFLIVVTVFLPWELIKTCSCTVWLTNRLPVSPILLAGSSSTDTYTYTQILLPPVEGNDDTQTHPPVFPFSCTGWGSCCAEGCYSRWSPLFGNNPDHVTTKWWKLWAVCKLSISTDRLEAGNRQGTWKYIHALRRRRTEIAEPQQWWVDGLLFCEDKKKRKRGICSLFFFPHCQQTGREREGGAAFISTVVLWIWSSSIQYGGDAHNSCWWFYYSDI